MKNKLHIGVLALQGDFAEHIQKLQGLGCSTTEIRLADQLNNIDGLIIPGGESTTNAKLEAAVGKTPIFDAITKTAKQGLPIWGTCMGSILLAKDIEGSIQGRIGLMDITVRRNAFGPQRASAEILLSIPVIGEKIFPGIFIRAPLFIKAAKSVEVLSSIEEGFVMAREGNLLATAFHPEMTEDDRVHKYFLSIAREK